MLFTSESSITIRPMLLNTLPKAISRLNNQATSNFKWEDSMTSLDAVRYKLNELYHTHPQIHVNVSLSNPKVSVRNEAVIIKDVYPHIFRIEEYSSGSPKCYTWKYVDVLTKDIQIVELGDY